MSARIAVSVCLACVLLAGCQKPEPTGGPLRAGPYPESRAVIEWLRVKGGDPEVAVVKWVERTEVPGGSPGDEAGHVKIVVHFRATRDNVNRVWAQTLQVRGNQVTAETLPAPVE